MMRKAAFLLVLCFVSFSLKAADSPPSITLAFDHIDGDIYVTDFTADPISITPSKTYEMIPAWSPDGTQMAFLSSASYATANEAYLEVMTLATHETRQLGNRRFTSETTLTWSPDGRYIAATVGTIYVVDVQSGKDRGLPEVYCGPCSVNWLADSSGLIVDSGGEIFKANLDGTKPQQLTHAPPNAYRPALSPISSDVVFASSYEDIPGLYNMRLDDLAISQIAALPGFEIFPHYWSPDGQYIAFGVTPAYGSKVIVPGSGDVYVVKKEGTDMRVVTGDGTDSLLGWANDSQYVLYYAGEPGGAGGSFMTVNISTRAQTRLSSAAMETLCSYGNCRHFAIRP